MLKLVVLDAMGVIYEQGDDVANLLIPFAKSRGCRLSDAAIEMCYLECSSGKCSPAEFWQQLGLSDQDNLEDEFRARYQLTPGVFEFLEHMQQEGYPVACLSNDVAEWSLKVRRLNGLDRFISPWMISSEVGVRKPDPKIFQRFVKLADVPPRECLFVDDRPGNLESARAVGFNVVMFGETSGQIQHRRAATFQELCKLIHDFRPRG